MSNGNLSREERLALEPGTLVSYMTRRGLAPIRGTVAKPAGLTGSVVLDDGTWVGLNDFLQVEERASEQFPHRTEFAPDDQVHAGIIAAGEIEGDKKGTEETQRTEGKVGGKDEVDPPTARRKGGNLFRHGIPRADHGLWLRAVEAVLDLMGNGARRADAIAKVAGRPEFAGIGLNQHAFSWWSGKFRKQGLVARSFAGGHNVKALPAGRSMQPILVDPMTETEELRDRCDALAEDLAGSRALHRKAEDEVRRLSAELEAMHSAECRRDVEPTCCRPQDDPLAALCAERIGLVEAGKARLEVVRQELEEISEAVEVVRKSVWCYRRLRALAGTRIDGSAAAVATPEFSGHTGAGGVI